MSTNPMHAARFRPVVVPVAVTVTLLASIGVALAATGGPDGSVAPPDPLNEPVSHSGASYSYVPTTRVKLSTASTTDDAIHEIAAGLGPQANLLTAKTSAGPNGADVTLELSRNDDTFTSMWLDELALGALGELLRTDQTVLSEVFESAEAVGPGSGGRTTTTGLGVGAVQLGQDFASPSDAALSARVEDVARQYGLAVSSTEVLHPLDSALMVTLTIPDGVKIDWTMSELRAAISGSTPDVEGVCVDLRSSNGDELVKSSATYRTGGGGVWFAPGQDERFDIEHGSTPEE